MSNTTGTVRHDSHVRTDWLNAGMSRAKAAKLVEQADAIITADIGKWDVRNHSHLGRRESYCDFIAVTSPGGWNENHAGSATVKVRGCDGFRRYALLVLRELVSEYGSDTPKIVTDYFGAGRVDVTQTFHPSVGWRDAEDIAPATIQLAKKLAGFGFTRVAIQQYETKRTADFAIRELLTKGA